MVMLNQGLDLFQWGAETVKGTAVPATSKQPVRMTFRETGEIISPELATALMVRERGEEQIVRNETGWTASGPVIFEQLPNWLSMFIEPLVVATGVGPFVHTYVRDVTTMPDCTTWTLESRENNGAGQIDKEYPYAFGTRLRFSGGQNQLLMAEYEGVARPMAESTLTPALAFPASMEIPDFSQSKVWINSSWATLGGTALVGTVIGWEFEFNTGFYPFYSADQRVDKSFTRMEVNPDTIGLTARIRMAVEAAGQYATEQTAAAARAIRAVRIQAIGSSSRELEIDFLARYIRPSIPEREVANGMKVVTLDLIGRTDKTNLLSIAVTNGIEVPV